MSLLWIDDEEQPTAPLGSSPDRETNRWREYLAALKEAWAGPLFARLFRK